MYQEPTLIQTLAAIGINVEATDTHITLRSINQEWLSAACMQQWLEEDLAEIRLRWYGSKEAELADFCRWQRQADAELEEAEEEEYDWREDAFLDGWSL